MFRFLGLIFSCVVLQLTAMQNLTLQFAQFFNNKDALGIGSLLDDDFILYDPGREVRGKANMVEEFQKQFRETEKVIYEVVNAYEDGRVGILEFRIAFGEKLFYGVDLLEWENGKIKELRCYYNPPEAPTKP
ncbi:MAG TPA: nuclear transport factor 2 family protein [Chlamydiales bacterium]|nr:nuclear transport factor 2 family protein [Chlamydiales bacterium]